MLFRFVEFSTEAEVQAAVDQLNNMYLNGSSLRVFSSNNNESANRNNSNFVGQRTSFENSSPWGSAPSEPTARIPRDDAGRL